MHRYQAYGLSIRSELPIPELPPHSEAPADVTVHVGSERIVTEGGDGPCVYAADGAARFAWRDVGIFDVRRGCEIEIRPHPGVDREILRLPLLGVVFGALLHQRGLVVLHASSALVNGRAVCIAGGKGFGKSTLAAALYRIGHGVLGDDVAALELRDENSAVLHPAFPYVNLWPHAARSVGDDPDELPSLRTGGVKRALSVSKSFEPRPVPLDAIHVLDFGTDVSIHPIGKSDAFAHLVPHCYAARYFGEMDGTPQRLLESCGGIVRIATICRLTRRDAVKDAFAAAHRIEAHAQRHSPDSVRHAAA